MILMRMMMKHILSSHQIDFLVFNVKLSVSVDISVAWVAAVVDSMNNNIKITITMINSMNKATVVDSMNRDFIHREKRDVDGELRT